MRSALLARRTTAFAAVVIGVGGLLSAMGLPSASAVAQGPRLMVAAKVAAAGHSTLQSKAIIAAKSHLPAGQAMACPKPRHFGEMQCMAVVPTSPTSRVNGRWAASVAVRVPPGYSPANLRSAYNLTAYIGRGRGETVAVVDAFSDPRAASDLARYRSHYGLPACTTASKCLRIVNQQGQASPLPAANANWALEESLDLDMVSAICPHCRILLVEGRNSLSNNLGAAENIAVRMGAKFVSNSWNSGGEGLGETSLDHFFNHRGVVIDFAAGDFKYGTAYPTDSQYVTAVGGTALYRAKNRRGWTETAWSGTGSGCAILLAKAPWQQGIDNTMPNGCLNRTGNDVSADAALSTGVSISDTYKTGGTWLKVGGTSVATPLVTAVYALAGNPAPGTYPASYLYQHRTRFFDVTGGSNGACDTFRQYLCRAVRGYDGPTGLGTPNGIAGFSRAGAAALSLADPGTQDVTAGTALSVTINGIDAAAKPAASCTVTSVPIVPSGSSLTASPVAGTANCTLTGNLAASAQPYKVTVTAQDTAGQSGRVSFMIAALGNLTTSSPTPGFIWSLFEGNVGGCLDAGAGTVGTPVLPPQCRLGFPSQQWTFLAGSAPDSAGEVTIGGLCLGLAQDSGVLANCGSDTSTQWFYESPGWLVNGANGRCLASGPSNVPVTTIVCGSKSTLVQNWVLPASQITSGITGLCLDNPGDTATAVHMTVAACGTAGDMWIPDPLQPRICWSPVSSGTCATPIGPGQPGSSCLSAGSGLLDDAPITLSICGTQTQQWLQGPGGEVINIASGLCLADPGNGPSGTSVELEDCYGLPGEVWGVN